MNTLKAEKRSMDVKAKKLRREGFVTGNLFGREIAASVPIKISAREVDSLLKTSHKGSQILLSVEGKTYHVLIKDIEYNAMKRSVEEIDFQALVSGQKVHSVAEVIFKNHEKVITGVLEELMKEIPYKALPEDLVDQVMVDVGELRAGDTLYVKDLDIAANDKIELLTDLDKAVVTVAAVNNQAPEEEEEAAE